MSQEQTEPMLPSMVQLRDQVHEAEGKLRQLTPQSTYQCPHCDSPMTLGETPWKMSDARLAAGVEGEVGSIASMNLISEGYFTLDDQLLITPSADAF